MEFSISDYISAAALLIAIASAYYTKKQSDLARIASHNDYRAHLSDKHAAYRHALKQTTEKHKATIRHLSTEANSALVQAACVFDQYDTSPNDPRRLRHLINECASMLYYAFKGQLAWQTGLNLYSRMMHVIRIEANDDHGPSTFDHANYRALFEQQYFEDPNAHQETALLSNSYFLNLIQQIENRIDTSNRGKLLLEVQDIISSFNTQFKMNKPRFSETAGELEELIEDGKLEHFDLRESPKIYRRLKYTRSTYDTLSHLHLLEIDTDYADKYYNFVTVSILNLTILYAVVGFESWGWDHHKR